MARQFGVISIISGTTTAVADIIAESVNKSNSVETATARDESGKVIDMQAYSKTTTLTINGLLNVSTPTIDAGSVIVISGGTFLVTSAEQVESNTDYVRYNLTATQSDNCVPVAYTAPTV
jgi:hypothetical protein